MIFKNIKKNWFISFFIIFLLLSESVFANVDYANTKPMFIPNDYSRTLFEYGTNTFDTAIFGNSTIVTGLRNESLPEKYGNVGIAYGSIDDYYKMIKKGYIVPKEEIVITANYLSFLDNWTTVESYPWHRHSFIPYVYFYREETGKYLMDNIKNYLIKGENDFFQPVEGYYFEKALVKGQMTDKELDERVENFSQRFDNKTMEDFSGNINSLEKIIDYAKNNNLKLKFVWMPINPYYTERPQYIDELNKKVSDILLDNNIEYIDYTNVLGKDFFHDLIHISWDIGAEVFTEELLEWLEK